MATEKGRGQLTLTDMNDVLAQATAPTNPTDGSLWFNTAEKQLYVYQGGKWIISNNIIVGGVNLLEKSNKFTSGGSATGITVTTVSEGVLQAVSTSGNGNWLVILVADYSKLENKMNEGDTFTLSLEMKSPDHTKLPNFYIKEAMPYQRLQGKVGTEWSQVYITNTWKKTGNMVFHLGLDSIVGTTLFRNIKVEKGNIPTAWDLAPEDIDGRISDAEKTLNNMSDDSIIDFSERKIIKDSLTDILGYVIADTATALPTSTVSDAGTNGKGSYYNGRRNALSAGYPTTNTPYTDLKTKYDALKTYLESFATKPWDLSSAKKDSYTSVDKAVFRSKWLDYYTAELNLANAVIEWLKKVADDISIGGTNYASNGHFDYDITQSLWKSSYVGGLKEVIDISTEAPPFKKALHIKNTTAVNGGILSPTLWSGISAQSMVDKEITISYWLKYSGITQGANAFNLGRFGELIVEGQKSDGTKVSTYWRIDSTSASTNANFVSGTDTTWKKYTATHKLSLPSGTIKLTNVYFKHGLEGCIGEFWTTGLQIEIGNRASDWSENPDDLRQRFTNVELLVDKDSIINRISTTSAWLGKAEVSDIANSSGVQLIHKSRFSDNIPAKWTFGSPWAIDNTTFLEGFGTVKADISGRTTDGNISIYSETIPITAGELLNASAYVYTDSLATDVENRGYSIFVECFDSTSTRIATLSTSGKPSENGVWERRGKTFTMPVNTVKARFRFAILRNGRVWVAKPMLAKSAMMPAYSEHTDELAVELSTQISQTAGKVAIVVKEDNTIDGSSIASSIVATPNAISLVSNNISFKGRVTFESLGTDLAPSFETSGKVKAGNLSGTVPDANIASANSWNTSKLNVDNMFSDMKVTPLEKNTLKNESDKIKKEYTQKTEQARMAGVPTTAYDTAYNAVFNVTPKLDAEILSSMTSTYTFGSSTLRNDFRTSMIEYFNQVAIISKNISDNVADIGMAMSGKMLYTDPMFRDGMNGISSYNNSGGTNLTVTRISNTASDSPSGSTNMLELNVSGATTSPGMGGFTFMQMSKANGIFFVRFIAKIPTGFYLTTASNSIGTGGTSKWLTPNTGTGKWEEYIYKITCGASGTFATTGFVYLSPTGSVTYPVKWHVDSATIYEHNATDYTVSDSAKMISDMISDGKLSPSEKLQLRKEWGLIVAEYITTKGIAQNYSVSTTNYDSAYNTLNAQVPSLISNVTVTSDAPSNLRTNFENYYKRRAELSSAVTDKTYSMQNNVSGMNNNALLDQWTGSLPTGTVSHGTASFIKKETSIVRDGLASVRFNGMGTSESGLNLNAGFLKPNIANNKYLTVELSFYLVSGSTQGVGVLLDWVGMNNTAPLTNRVSLTLESMTEETIVAGRWYNAKATVKRPHDNVSGYTGMASYLMANYPSLGSLVAKDIIVNRLVIQGASAEEIKSYKSDVIITDMASDLKITPQEKIQLKKEWSVIQKDFPKIKNTASNAGMSYDSLYFDYTSDYDQLNAQVTPVLSNMLVTSTVTSAFRTAFDEYYASKAGLIDSYNTKAYEARKRVDSWTAPNKVTIDGSKLEADSIVTSTVQSIANGSSTKITGGQVVSDGTFTRTFEGTDTDPEVTYISRYESFNGSIKVGISSKKTPDGVERVPANGGRSLYLTDKNITTQRNIHAYSPDKNGARFIDFFSEETAESNVVGGGMHIYSGQKLYVESGSTMQFFSDSNYLQESYSSMTLRSYVSYIKLQPEYDNQGNNEFSFEVVDASSSSDTDGILRYGSFAKTSEYGSGLLFSKSFSENTVYVTNGQMKKGSGQLNAYKLSAQVVMEGNSRVVTNDRMASGREVITGITANTPKSKAILFGQTFSSTPDVVISASTTVPGTTVTGVSVSDVTTRGFTAWVTRTNSTDTGIQWIAYKNENG